MTNDLDKDKVKLNQKQIIKNRLKMSRNRQLGMGGAKTIPEKALHANKDLEFDFKRTAR